MIDTGHGIVKAEDLNDWQIRGMIAQRERRILDLKGAYAHFQEWADKVERDCGKLEVELAELKDEQLRRGI